MENQMEGLEVDANSSDLLEESLPSKEDSSPSNTKEEEAKSCNEVTMDEIVKELKCVRRQNTITHRLLSALIIVTSVWQLSQVSMLLSVKEKISRPFRYLKRFLFVALHWRRHSVGMLPPPELPQLQLDEPIGLPALPQADLLSSLAIRD